MTTTFRPATEAQTRYLSDLLGKRVVEAEQASGLRAAIAAGTLSVNEASYSIDLLRKAPLRVAVGPDLSANITGSFALPMEQIAAGLTLPLTNDYLFVEIRKFKGRVYMRRLHGSVGYFRRTRFSLADETYLANLLADPRTALEATQKFGELHSCCGRCKAELTDEVSRLYKLGPDCRKAHGIRA